MRERKRERKGLILEWTDLMQKERQPIQFCVLDFKEVCMNIYVMYSIIMRVKVTLLCYQIMKWVSLLGSSHDPLKKGEVKTMVHTIT